ncbi:MAG: hypothetical protein ABIE68_02265 [bacterium]
MKKTIVSIFLIFLVFTVASAQLPGCGSSSKETPDTGGIFVTTNKGESWQPIGFMTTGEAIASKSINYLKQDPANGDTIFAGINGQGMIKSVDSGNTWENTSLTAGTIKSISFDTKQSAITGQSAIVYAGGEFSERGKIFKSIDNGETFTEIFSDANTDTYISFLEVDSYENSRVFALISSGVFMVSNDYGNSWDFKYTFDDQVNYFAISPLDSRIMYAVEDKKGFYFSNDGGSSWEDLTESINDSFEDTKILSNVYAIAKDFKSVDRIHILTEDGFYTSNNNGNNWQSTGPINLPERVKHGVVRINPNNRNEIFLGLNNSFYRSTDGGSNWSVYQLNDSIVYDILIDQDDTNSVYLGMLKN